MIEIRRASSSDAQALTELGRKTFVETFSKFNRQEDMDLYVSETFNSKRQLDEIKDPARVIEIAWMESEPVGFLHLLKSQPDPSVKSANSIEILRLYADAKWHGKGIGAALMDRSIEIAREQGYETIWLGVWEKNSRAQAFYKKYGFEPVGQHIFRLGTDEQVDTVMTRKI